MPSKKIDISCIKTIKNCYHCLVIVFCICYDFYINDWRGNPFMEREEFTIQEINFTKTLSRNFSSGGYYQILLISKGECYFEFDNNFVYCNTETAIFLKPEQKIAMNYRHNKYPLF